MVKKKFWGTVVAGLVTILLMISFGCAPSPAPPAPAEEQEVLIGKLWDISGPIAESIVRSSKGFDNFRKWAEENEPIPGVKVVDIWEDTAYSAERYLPCYKRFKEKGVVLMTSSSSTANSVLGELFRRDKIAHLSSGAGYVEGFFPKNTKEKGPSYIFMDRPQYADTFAAAAMTFMEKWKEAGYKEKPKAMFITWDCPYGRGPVELGTPWAEEYGFEMLPPEFFPTGATELISQLRRAKEHGANFIYMNSVASHFAMMLKDARRLGIEFGVGPGKMILCDGCESHNPEVLRMAGEAAEGAWTADNYPSWTEASEKKIEGLLKMGTELQMKYQGEVERHSSYFLGFYLSRVSWDVIKRAAEKHGPENVTTATAYEALCETKDLDIFGVCAPASYGKYERRPFRIQYVHEVSGGEWHDIGRVEAPWLTPAWEEYGLPGWRPKK